MKTAVFSFGVIGHHWVINNDEEGAAEVGNLCFSLKIWVGISENPCITP